MSRSLNKVMLIGNLGKDPETKYTPGGVALTTFSIATSSEWKDADGTKQEKTEWHNIIAWRKLAEICAEWLKKGQKVYVEGRLETQSWDKEGVKHYRTQVVVDQMIMLGSPSGAREASAQPEGASGATGAAPGQATDNGDDLPF